MAKKDPYYAKKISPPSQHPALVQMVWSSKYIKLHGSEKKSDPKMHFSLNACKQYLIYDDALLL